MTSSMRTAWALVVAVLLAAGGAACAKARAETIVLEGPPLQVPEPPSRVLVPVEELVSTPLVSEPEPAPVAATPRTPPRPTTEAKPQPAPAPVVAPPLPVAEPRDLRTASPTNTDSERSVREVLARAARDIVRVEYSRLSADGRAQVRSVEAIQRAGRTGVEGAESHLRGHPGRQGGHSGCRIIGALTKHSLLRAGLFFEVKSQTPGYGKMDPYIASALEENRKI